MFLKKRDNFIVHLSITSVDVLFVKKKIKSIFVNVKDLITPIF